MRRKLNRSPDKMARKEKILERLQVLEINSMDGIKEQCTPIAVYDIPVLIISFYAALSGMRLSAARL